MRAALATGRTIWSGSLDLERSRTRVLLTGDNWQWQGRSWAYPETLKARTIYYWDGADWAPAMRYTDALIKLVPTTWGVPTFEIDGIKMLPSAQLSPLEDARRKVALVNPEGKSILDTCGGMGYYAVACLDGGAASILSFEKNADVLWLRSLNPWSPSLDAPSTGSRLHLQHADILEAIVDLPDASVDAILHDPPRFGIAGELYSLDFYHQLARVIRPGGALFHYTGAPNRLTSGRDVPNEVATRLDQAGFATELALDGVFATRKVSPKQASTRHPG